MKLVIASDIHGDIECAERVIDIANRENADRIVLLGDILYHGPRNDLPTNYAPKKVAGLLNANAERLLCIKGNCEAEVDGMVLDFPVLCEFGWICDGEVTMYLSHGHKFNPENLPPLPQKSIFLYGHTHVPKIENVGGVVCINPGSVTLPKENNPQTLAIYENGMFKIITFEGEMLQNVKVC